MTEEQKKDVTNNVLYKACNNLMVTMRNHDFQIGQLGIMMGDYNPNRNYEKKYLKLLYTLSVGIREIKKGANNA